MPITAADIAAALPPKAVTTLAHLPYPLLASGKVREIFDLGDALLLVATDRLSAFDVILPDGIPGKGIILTQMSNWWFERTAGLIPNHLLPDQPGEFARRGLHDRDLQLRSMIVRKLKPPHHRVRSPRLSHRQRLALLSEIRPGLRHSAPRRTQPGRPAPPAHFHPHDQGTQGPARRADQRRPGRGRDRPGTVRPGQGPQPPAVSARA